MAVDLHWIGTGISSGTSHNGFGSIVSFSSVPAGCPPLGVLSVVPEEYTVEQGGTSVYFHGPYYPNQNRDLITFNDGNCGTFTEYGSVSYKPYGDFIAFAVSPHGDGEQDLEVPSGSASFFVNTIIEGYNGYHDGNGSYFEQNGGVISSVPYGELYIAVESTTEVPSESTMYWSNGTATAYYSDGDYGYYAVGVGEYNANGQEVSDTLRHGQIDFTTQVPADTGEFFPNGKYSQNSYFWNGSGGYYEENANTNVGDYFPYGTFITNAGGTDYFWDGNGGYYN